MGTGMKTSSVSVYYSDGKPAKNKRVDLSISGLLSGGMAHGITDASGTANIVHGDAVATAKVIVNGKQVGNFQIPGRTTVTI